MANLGRRQEPATVRCVVAGLTDHGGPFLADMDGALAGVHTGLRSGRQQRQRCRSYREIFHHFFLFGLNPDLQREVHAALADAAERMKKLLKRFEKKNDVKKKPRQRGERDDTVSYVN